MSSEFSFDSKALERALRRLPKDAGDVLKDGMLDIKNDWQKASVDAAPLDKGNLRRNIKAKSTGSGMNTVVTITGNALATSGRKPFNYGLYIHEYDAGGANVNGEKKFLKKPAEDNFGKWQGWLFEELKKGARKSGFK